MKNMTKFKRFLPMAATILAAIVTVPLAAADQQVPFKGAFQGNDTDTCFSFPIVCVATDGTGVAALLGQFKFTMENQVNLTNGTDSGTTTLISANGDTITTTFTGAGYPTDTPNVFAITEVHTIAGGTGRFAGAQGSFIVERLASGDTFLTSGSFHGTITPPGAAH